MSKQLKQHTNDGVILNTADGFVIYSKMDRKFDNKQRDALMKIVNDTLEFATKKFVLSHAAFEVIRDITQKNQNNKLKGYVCDLFNNMNDYEKPYMLSFSYMLAIPEDQDLPVVLNLEFEQDIDIYYHISDSTLISEMPFFYDIFETFHWQEQDFDIEDKIKIMSFPLIIRPTSKTRADIVTSNPIDGVVRVGQLRLNPNGYEVYLNANPFFIGERMFLTDKKRSADIENPNPEYSDFYSKSVTDYILTMKTKFSS